MFAALVLLFHITLVLGVGDGKLKERFSWNNIDYEFDSKEARDEAIKKRTFIPNNALPTGIAVSDKKIFVTIPRRRPGVPATLAYFSTKETNKSPKLIPYPSFKDNEIGSCDNIISVNRGVRFDNCDRLWVFDYGRIGGKVTKEICPPRIHVFDLNTNKKLRMYTLKKHEYTSTSIFTSATVEAGKTCDDFYFYLTDQKGLIVYSWKEDDSWRFDHPFMLVDPISTNYRFGKIDFQWNESGIFATALSPVQEDGYRTLYFHALSAFREFSVSTEILHDKTKVNNNYFYFKYVGSREEFGRSTSEVMGKNGVLFFNLVDNNATACWNSKQPYNKKHIAIVAEDDDKLIFPSASVIDGDQTLWILSNKLPLWQFSQLSSKKVNFRIFSGSTKELVKGTVCE